uniref:DUF465 domain-containing protein n=1 Tax=Steinernema glaseri TaxID=37863 RepID=A0A1I7YR50_9BILA
MTMGSREEVDVDVKALTAAYERRLASLKTKPNKPIAKLRRRLLSS